MEMSYHCKVERANRVQHIINEIGIGQVMREKYTRTFGQIEREQAGRYICITSSGITIIKTEDKLRIITMYVTTMTELIAVYGGQKNIPACLKKKVSRNESRYIQNGKTIW